MPLRAVLLLERSGHLLTEPGGRHEGAGRGGVPGSSAGGGGGPQGRGDPLLGPRVELLLRQHRAAAEQAGAPAAPGRGPPPERLAEELCEAHACYRCVCRRPRGGGGRVGLTEDSRGTGLAGG